MDGGEPVGVRQVKRSLREACAAAVQACAAAARIAFWNALALGAALLVAVAAGEVYLRATWPFAYTERPTEFVPGVGTLLKPHAEVRTTNTLDFWTVERANSLGFLDREPPSPERAAASCHVAIVGDSFVEANQVPLSDKVQVRLEQMAVERLPAWDITVAAYGSAVTGQVAQLPWWDEWIRHRPPKLVVLVFTHNDFPENGKMQQVGDLPYAMVRRGQDGSPELFTPPARFSSSPPSRDRLGSVGSTRNLYLQRWVDRRTAIWRANLSPAFPSLVRPWPSFWRQRDRTFTAFAFDEWQKRAQEAGSRLVALQAPVEPRTPATQSMLNHLKRLAVERDIPVVDPLGHILLRGGHPRDAHFLNDGHWSPQGHQWVAEALLEWMAGNPSVCGRYGELPVGSGPGGNDSTDGTDSAGGAGEAGYVVASPPSGRRMLRPLRRSAPLP